MPELPRHILDSLREGCQVITPDYTYLYINAAAATHGKQTPADLIGRTMMECYPGIDTTPFFSTLRQCMEQREHHRLENEFVFPDGNVGWFELRLVPVPEGVFILSLDITERRLGEGERQQLAHAINESAECVLITGRTGVITYVNPAFEATTGYTKAEVLGQNPRLLRSPKQSARAFEEMWGVLHANKTWRGRLINQRKDGSPFTLDTSISPVHDAAGAIVSYVSVGRDVTTALRLEAQLQQTQRLETIGRLAGGIAHDFNNLLSVIISYADVMAAAPELEASWRADASEIREAGMRAAALTRQLLTFSRQQMMQPEVLSLNTSVRNMEKLLRRLIGEDIDILTVLAPDLGGIKADPSQLEQVVMNLAVNARDAMPFGGHLTISTNNITLDDAVTCERLGLTPGDFVVLSVADTGVGMNEATRARLFEPFFTTKGPGRGTGLGLPTVYGIIRQSGGAISVYSEVGQGTTFKLYFPRESRDFIGEEAGRAPTRRARPGETILLVEDEKGVRLIAERILKDVGYTVLTAASGAEALEVRAAYAGPVHLMLTDVIMPGMNGRELTVAMRELYPGLRTLYMSGYTDDAVIHHGVLNRESAFISKPFGTAELTGKVREVLDGVRPQG